MNWIDLQVWAQLSLCLTKHYAMKTYGGAVVYIHVFSTSVLVAGEWSASRPERFNPLRNSVRYERAGGWGGFQSRYGLRIENILTYIGTGTPTLRPFGPEPVAIPTVLTWPLLRT
jgi:hypothetical protein